MEEINKKKKILEIRFKDDGTTRAVSWQSVFKSTDVSLSFYKDKNQGYLLNKYDPKDPKKPWKTYTVDSDGKTRSIDLLPLYELVVDISPITNPNKKKK